MDSGLTSCALLFRLHKETPMPVESFVSVRAQPRVLARVRTISSNCVLLSAFGCGILTANDTCVGSPASAVTVTITDALTGRPPSTTVSLMLEEGMVSVGSTSQESADPLRISSTGTGRAGTFRVTVRAAGYADVVNPNVVVPTTGRCEAVQTQSLTVALVRLP